MAFSLPAISSVFFKVIFWRFFLLLAGCFLCVACSGSVGRLVDAGTFNAELLNTGGLLIGGVSASSPLSLQQRVDYAELLQDIFRQKDPELSTVGPREVYKTLGRNLYTQMLNSYQFHETGSTVFMNLLHEKFPQVRYVVYARIEGSDVQQHSVKLPDDSGQELVTVHGVAVSMRVFDLHLRRLQVWGARLQKTVGRNRKVYGRYTEEQLKNLYPDPAKIEKVLTKTYVGLVTDMIAVN